MTYEEAEHRIIRVLPDDFLKNEENREALIFMGIALEKQIPKKVTKSVCPSCNRIFLFRHGEKRKGGYCDNCGQALDWSDTE